MKTITVRITLEETSLKDAPELEDQLDEVLSKYGEYTIEITSISRPERE